MILLIPTNDGISVASSFDKANAFRYMTIVNGQVKEDELRRVETNLFEGFLSTLTKDTKNTPEKIGTIITSEISNELEMIVKSHNFDIILTREPIITNAVLDYLSHYATRESDYCCMP